MTWLRKPGSRVLHIVDHGATFTRERGLVAQCPATFPRPWEVSYWTSQRALGEFTDGRWGWELSGPQPLTSPVPCKGRQGVFRLPPEVSEAVQR